jgi:hypothetical protein
MKKISLSLIFIIVLLTLSGCATVSPRFGIWEIGIILFMLPGLALYFLPSIIAAARHKQNMLGIVLLNALAGWSLIGWIIALVWAFSSDK